MGRGEGLLLSFQFLANFLYLLFSLLWWCADFWCLLVLTAADLQEGLTSSSRACLRGACAPCPLRNLPLPLSLLVWVNSIKARCREWVHHLPGKRFKVLSDSNLTQMPQIRDILTEWDSPGLSYPTSA